MTRTFTSDFRARFTRGLATVLPTVLTIAIVIWLFQTIDRYVGRYINSSAKSFVAWIWKLDAARVNQIWDDHYLHVIGFLLAIVLVYVVGLLVASFIGRMIWRRVESLLNRLPLIKQIYPSIKQVTDFLILNEENKARFSRVVALEYPRKGIWSLGLITSDGIKTLREAAEADLVTVFIPSSPTPITGYTVTVRRDEVIDMPFTIDEALRFTISGGVIHPGSRPQPALAPAGGEAARPLPTAPPETQGPPDKERPRKETQR